MGHLMAYWKERNFVPDSDDEGDLDDLSTNELQHEARNSLEGFVDIDDVTETTTLLLSPKSGKTLHEGDKGVDGEEEDAGIQTTVIEPGDVGIDESLVGLRTGGDVGMLQDGSQDKLQDELALPTLHALPSAKRAPRPLKQLFSDDNEPDELLRGELERSSSSDALKVSATQLATALHHDIVPMDTSMAISDAGEALLSSNNHSIPSSPLSELSLVEPSSQSTMEPSQHDLASQSIGSYRPTLFQVDTSHEADFNHPSNRRFRARKAIQLNPYAIESELYKTALKSRGLKPLQIQPETEEERQQTENPNTDVSDDDETQMQNDTYEHRASVSLAPNPPPLSSSPTGNEDDLPDLEALLSNTKSVIVPNGFKRRKVAHTYSRPKARNGPALHGRTTKDVNAVRPLLEVQVPKLSSRTLPPSPSSLPSSRPASSRGENPHTGFRYPIGMTPPQLQTPAVSSEVKIQTQKQSFAELLPVDDSSTEARSVFNEIDDLEVSSSSSHTGNEDESQVLLAQRRLRGVLPASWIRLDQKKQLGKLNGFTGSHSRAKKSPVKEIHRGVARPIPSRRQGLSEDRVATDPFNISDDSLSDDEVARDINHVVQLPNVSKDVQGHQRASYYYDSDSMEDNYIDPMLHTDSYAGRKSRKSPRSHQTRLTDALPQSRSHWGPRASKPERSYSNSSQSRGTKVQGRSSKRRKLNHEMQPRITDAMRVGDLDNPSRGDCIHARRIKSKQSKHRYPLVNNSLQLQGVEEAENDPQSLSESGQADLEFFRDDGLPTETRQPLDTTSGDRQNLQNPMSESDPEEGDAFSTPGKPILQTTKSRHGSMGTINTNIMPIDTNKNRAAPTSRNAQPGRRRGQIWSHLQQSNSAAPAMLETERRRSMHARKRHTENNPVLERYLEPSIPPKGLEPEVLGEHSMFHDDSLGERLPSNHKRKKPRKVQSDSEARLRNEVESTSLEDETCSTPLCVGTDAGTLPPSIDVVCGLGPYGTEYPISFDVKRFSCGPCFDRSTLIGSGLFLESLTPRDFDTAHDSLCVPFGESRWQWGYWNESVSSQMGLMIDQVVTTLTSTTHHDNSNGARPQGATRNLEFIVRYFNSHLHFLDPIDRTRFLDRCSLFMSYVISAIEEQKAGTEHAGCSPFALVRICCRCLIIANRLSEIAQHHLASSDQRTTVKSLIGNFLDQTAYTVFGDGFDDLISFSREERSFCHPSQNAAQCKGEALVILLHVLRQTNSSMEIWDLLQQNDMFVLPSSKPVNVQLLDQLWRNLFSILPLFSINAQGEAEATKEQALPQNWKLVKQLISPIFRACLSSSTRQGSTFNAYCRTLFARCLHLIREWNWVKCDTIIGSLFDFFAKNNLRHLRYEESHGSPGFLERLDEDPDLAIEKKDLCFHIFLKITAVGIRKMRSSASRKTISNISWRLIPNHNRELPKDQSIRQEDLEEVRNHHDLLSTLYWATPPTCRIRIAIIQKLVDVEVSHKEACHISIRSWSNLISFQASTDEPIVSIEPFMEWYDEILGKILRQHTLARTEIESQAQNSEVLLGRTISRRDQEWAIGNNQRQIESILGHALGSLGRAITASKNTSIATKLITPKLGQVFEIFDEKQPRINGVVEEALNVIVTFIARVSSLQQESDSQDFGDLQEFESLMTGEDAHAHTSLNVDIQKSLRGLLSNCFGADTMVEDKLLVKVVETWLAVAQHEVKQGSRSWDDYIGQYSKDSWNDLRNTEQTRKFTPLFLSRIMDADGDFYQQHKGWVFKIWMEGLVERESLIKFQDVLTKSLLNQDSPLLENPPFWRDGTTGDFKLSLAEFRERRISLLSCVLSNMRESVSFMNYHGLPGRESQKREYEDMLKHLMRAMKDNYQSLGYGSDVRGAYVDFVHRVIDLLQQHTAEICPVDRFFMDLSTFPLPESDPTYAVSRLKSYRLRLNDPKIPRQLASFVQTISERAAVDSQQASLVTQFHTSMQDEFEEPGTDKITLRSFLIQTIVPAYTDVALGTPCGWVVAAPLFLALQPMLEALLLDMDCAKLDSIRPMEATLLTLFYSLQQSMTLAINHEGYLELARVVRALTMYFALIIATLRPLDYFIRLGVEHQRITAFVQYFRRFALFASARMLDKLEFPHNLDGSAPQEDDLAWLPPQNRYHQARVFASQHLKDTLSKNWKLQGDRIVFGARRENVTTDLGPFEGEAHCFLGQVQVFMDALDRMPALGGAKRVKREIDY